MIEKMISELKNRMPFEIEGISWDQEILNIYGATWNFTTISAWRIVSNEKMIFGCYDRDSSNEINSLLGKTIIDISWQSKILTVDPVFMLSNGCILEIFSTDTYEPWTFSLKSEITYVASPSDPKSFE